MIKAKLAQSLAWRKQCPLYQIYLDLKKAKDAAPPETFLGHSKIGVPCRG
jgi:hypothetical protein